MKLSYAEPGFIAELTWRGLPVLLTVEPFAEAEATAAQAYATEVWDWLSAEYDGIEEYLPQIVGIKNTHWLEIGEPEWTTAQMADTIVSVEAVYARRDEGIMVYHDVGDTFGDKALVLLFSPRYEFCGIQLL